MAESSFRKCQFSNKIIVWNDKTRTWRQLIINEIFLLNKFNCLQYLILAYMQILGNFSNES